MAMSEAKRKANDKWNKENLKDRYDRIQVVVPKGVKNTIQEKAKEQGMSMNKYIVAAITSYMGEDIWAGGFDSLRPDDQQDQ